MRFRLLLLPINLFFLASVLTIAAASNAPDVDAYFSEIREFDYKNFRLDYLSWLFLWLLGVDNENVFHGISVIVFYAIVGLCKRVGNQDYTAMAALMPMAVGSQIRLLFAAAVFIIALQYLKSRRGILIPTLIASLFHFSFLFCLLFPLFIFFGPAFELLMPLELVVSYNIKLGAYLAQDHEIPSLPGITLLTLLIASNLTLLIKQKDARAYLVLIYILLIPYIENNNWIIFRRSVELILFLSYPFYFKNDNRVDNYKISYFIFLYCYCILNYIGYTKKLDFS